MLKAIFRKKSSEPSSYIEKEYIEPDMVRELYEEGSAMLSERFGFVFCVINVCSRLSSCLSWHGNIFVTAGLKQNIHSATCSSYSCVQYVK